MTKNEERFNIIAAKLYNFRCLIPYLFPSRPEFHTICAIAEKFGDKTCDRGKPIELPYMNSEIINNLIISITRLMSFFGKNSQIASPIQKKCKDICLEMNNLKRDTALTNCLLLPNEDVKLSIVECFFSIEVEQLVRLLILLNTNSTDKFIYQFPSYFASHTDIDINALANAKNYDEFLSVL